MNEKERFIMKTKNDFIEFYNLKYQKMINSDVKKVYQNYLKYRNKLIVEQCIMFILIIVAFYLFYFQKINMPLSIVLLSFSLFLFGIMLIFNIKLIYKKREKCCYKINMYLYNDIIAFLSCNTPIYKNNTQLAKEDFNKMDLFNLKILNYRGSNFTAASNDKKKFLLCDTILFDLVERIKTERYFDDAKNIEYITNYHYHEEIPIFKGLYYETTMKKENNKQIYLIPNNIKDTFVRKNISRYISFNGEKIELENLDFSEKYQVYSLDEIKSRYVLSLPFMEKINELDKIIPNKKYIVFKKDGRVSLFIDHYQIENLLNKRLKLKKEIPLDYILKFFDDVYKLFEIANILEDVNTFFE